MKKFLLIFINFLVFLHFASVAQTRFRIAERHYDKMRYAQAIEAYEEAFRYVAPTTNASLQLADSYFKVGDMKNA